MYIKGFFMTWGTFCGIPCPYKGWDEKARPAMLVCLPFLGLVLGTLWYGLFIVITSSIIDIPVALGAAILTAYPFVITGFIHLDGYMDCSDAILSRKPVEDKQRILKDSHVGGFAVAALAMLILIMYGAMQGVVEKALSLDNYLAPGLFIFIPFVSRCLSSMGVLGYQPMKTSQYSDTFSKEEGRRKKGFLGVALIIFYIGVLGAGAFLCENPFIIIIKIFAAAVLMVIIHWVAMRHGIKELGGMNGDISGYAITISEAGAVALLAIFM